VSNGINRHFRRVAIVIVMMTSVPIMILLGIVLALAAPYILTQIDIDRCLDSDGKWEYSVNNCVTENPGK
jgi:hypothetical protein